MITFKWVKGKDKELQELSKRLRNVSKMYGQVVGGGRKKLKKEKKKPIHGQMLINILANKNKRYINALQDREIQYFVDLFNKKLFKLLKHKWTYKDVAELYKSVLKDLVKKLVIAIKQGKLMWSNSTQYKKYKHNFQNKYNIKDQDKDGIFSGRTVASFKIRTKNK